MKDFSYSGQAVIEYLLVLTLVMVIGARFVSTFSRYLGNGMGSFNTVLSDHLTVGVCDKMCFPNSYINGRKGF